MHELGSTQTKLRIETDGRIASYRTRSKCISPGRRNLWSSIIYPIKTPDFDSTTGSLILDAKSLAIAKIRF